MSFKSSVHAVLVYTPSHEQKAPSAEHVSLALTKLEQAFGNVLVYSNSLPLNLGQVSTKDTIVINPISRDNDLWHALQYVQKNYEESKEGYDSIAICYGWYPLLDNSLLDELLQEHEQYLAHYSFSENVPIGFLPDLVAIEFLRETPPQESDDLRAFVLKHIEKYDVEVFFKNPDLRPYRLNLSTSSVRSQNILEQLLAKQPPEELNYANMQNLIQTRPEILRSYPAYFEIEVSTQSPVQPDYWPPRPQCEANENANTHNIEMSLIDKLLEDIKANGFHADATIALGGLGEPLLHPNFMEILETFLSLPQVKRVYLETFGVSLTAATVVAMAKLPDIEKLHIIVRLNTLKKQRYAQMYAANVAQQVYDNIKYLEEYIKGFPSTEYPFHLYAEMHRMKENDDEVTEYFNHFSDSPFGVILQKYNRYIDVLPERRAADLNPLHQDFCWHLARDFYLCVDGSVPLCKQDPFAQRGPSLSLQEHSVIELWNKTAPFHGASVRHEFAKIPLPCTQCDEWYTFNA